MCGWAPSPGKRVSRSKPTKTLASFSNARKEGKFSLVECGFVFRHYEKSSRYIEQYRENHSTASLEKEAEWRPVLGVDVPDPYLPKIAGSSQTFDRAKFIEAMSDYYKVAAMRSDLQNICLTGKRTENSDHKTATSSSTKLNKEGLPFVVTSSNGKQVSQKVENRKRRTSLDEERSDGRNNSQELIRTAPVMTQDSVLQYAPLKLSHTSTRDTFLPSVPSKPDAPHQIPDKPVSNAAKSESKDETKRIQKERIRLPKFQWTECHVKSPKNESKDKNIAIKTVERKYAKATENLQNSDSDESASRQLYSRGNLHLGSTVQTPKSKSKRPVRVTVGKCEVFSSTAPNTTERVRKPYQTRTKLPSETTFIRILGHQTGPPPKASRQRESKETSKGRPRTEERAFANSSLPLHYLSRFGRRNFHHVLEARSFKPGERKLRATALADFHN